MDVPRLPRLRNLQAHLPDSFRALSLRPLWPVRLGVRTPGFHPGSRGSNPLRATTDQTRFPQGAGFFLSSAERKVNGMSNATTIDSAISGPCCALVNSSRPCQRSTTWIPYPWKGLWLCAGPCPDRQRVPQSCRGEEPVLGAVPVINRRRWGERANHSTGVCFGS